jgi:glucokinase
MFLGIEIGGTKLQLGIGPGDGTLAGLWRGTADIAAGPEGIRKQITAAVPELLHQSDIDRSQIAGVGIGFGGPVNDATRTIIKSHQIEGWDDFPFADWIADMLGWPAILGNDADVAGLAEALFGAGKGLSPIFYITIGSGIGGGLIINGEIYRGCGRGAAEIGHLRVPGLLVFHRGYVVFPLGWYEGSVAIGIETPPPVPGPPAASFAFSPLEELTSGWALGRLARLDPFGRIDPDSPLYRLVCGQKDRITAAHIGQAAAQGDRHAMSVLMASWEYLSEGIAQVITLLCPRRIVIGGGVSLLGERLLFEPLRERVAAKVFKAFAECYDIMPAALGEEVVVHGALALARRRIQETAP